MATLSNPILTIEDSTGSTDANVTATVTVETSPIDGFFLGAGLLTLELEAQLFGDDDGPLQDNDLLFVFPSQTITSSGTYTFESVVSIENLNEDNGLGTIGERDEIYASFYLTTSDQQYSPAQAISSPNILEFFWLTDQFLITAVSKKAHGFSRGDELDEPLGSVLLTL